MWGFPAADSITFARQMKENNFSVSYLHGWKGTWQDEFWQALGKDAQYILCDGFWSADYPYPGAKQLGERYLKERGKTSVSIGATYALAQSLFQAIEKAGSVDSAKVKQAVLSNTFQTVMGPIKYQPNGVAIFPSTANQWKNGRQVLVSPVSLAKTKLELAPPWDQRK
jgi:branched-chain amino acid transport system substrate-binding protein